MPTDRLTPHRRRSRRKGERQVKVYGTEQLFEMFGCNDVDVLLAKLAAIGVEPYVSNGQGGSRVVFVSDYQLPASVVQRPSG